MKNKAKKRDSEQSKSSITSQVMQIPGSSGIPKPVFFLLSFLLMFGLYSSSLNGGPLFDDFFYIFNYEPVIGNISYWSVFKNNAWPLSISAEKIIFSMWKENYFYFHLINLLFHFLNSYILFKVVEKLQIPLPRFIFFLFLLHPSNVIAVSWMIQLKTLICFTFCFSSIYFFLQALEDKRYYALSWILFFFSTLSKSASLPIAAIFLVYSYKKKGKGQLLWLIPFLLIASYSSYRVLRSAYTGKATVQFESKDYIGKSDHKNKDYQVVREMEKKEIDVLSELKNRSTNVLKTSHYYFWQVILPLDSPPIRGSLGEVGFEEGFHMVLIMIVVVLIWKTMAGMSLISGYLMLTPFLGIVIAPYMNLSLVSEQHLYLVLPFFICFWVGLLTKVKIKYAQYLPILFMVFFATQTFKAVAYYENEIMFFAKSLESDPFNIPVAQNLAVSFVKNNEIAKGLRLTEGMIKIANQNPEMKESKYFANLVILHSQLEELLRNNP